MVKVDRRELPELYSVTGAYMKVKGLKYITYQLAGHHEMTVRYYVTEFRGPILAVNGLIRTGYPPVLSKSPYLRYYKDYITKLEENEGLYYIIAYDRKNYGGLITTTKSIAGRTSSDYWKLERKKVLRVT